MTCPKRVIKKKAFWFFKWKIELPHLWEIWSVERFAYSWRVTWRCSACESKNYTDGLDDEDIVREIGFIPNTGITGLIWNDEIKEQRSRLKSNKK